jgi:hypothetical protein
VGSQVAAIVGWAHRRRLVVCAVVLGAVLISLEVSAVSTLALAAASVLVLPALRLGGKPR